MSQTVDEEEKDEKEPGMVMWLIGVMGRKEKGDCGPPLLLAREKPRASLRSVSARRSKPDDPSLGSPRPKREHRFISLHPPL